MSTPEKLGTTCREGKSTYYARLSIRIQDDKVDKLQELLSDKWHAEDIVFRQLALPNYYRVEFLVNSPRKIFAFKKIVEQYGGRVLHNAWSRKVVPDKQSLRAITSQPRRV